MEKYVMSYELRDDQLKDCNLNNIISKMLHDDKSACDIIDLNIRLNKITEGNTKESYENGIEIKIYLHLK